MKQGGGEYDGKEAAFAEKLAMGEDMKVAGGARTRAIAIVLTRTRMQGSRRGCVRQPDLHRDHMCVAPQVCRKDA